MIFIGFQINDYLFCNTKAKVVNKEPLLRRKCNNIVKCNKVLFGTWFMVDRNTAIYQVIGLPILKV